MMRFIILLTLVCASVCPTSGQSLKSAYWRDIVKDDSLSLDRRLAIADSLIATSGSDNKSEMLELKLDLLHRSRNWSECTAVVNELLSLDAGMSPRRHFELENLCTRYMLYAGQYAEAFRRAYTMLKQPVVDSLKIFMIEPLIDISFAKIELKMLHGYPSELKTADSLLTVCAAISQPEDVTKMKELLLRTSASYHTSIGKYDIALGEINRVMEMTEEPEDRLRLYGYIADIYAGARNNDMAEHFYRKAIDGNPDLINRLVAVCNLMDLLNHEGRFIETIALYNERIQPEKPDMTPMLWLNITANYAQALDGVGRHEEAFDILFDNVVLRDSLYSSFTGQEKLSSFQLENELLAKNEELDRASARSWRLLAVIALLSVAVIVSVWIILRQRRRRSSLEKAVDVLNSRLCEASIHADEQNRELEARGAELTSRLLQMAHIQENVSEISSLAKSRTTTPAERLKLITERVRDIESNSNLWAMFQAYFEKTHPGFFRRLYELHPGLTSIETRMCAYILLNLTGKEIASLTCRSYRTVETVKYRLHKKLGLGDEPTQTYLRRIAGLS